MLPYQTEIMFDFLLVKDNLLWYNIGYENFAAGVLL